MKKVTPSNYRKDPLYPRVTRAVGRLLDRGAVVAPVDVLVEMSLLAPKSLVDWRHGRVPFLERVINCNLSRLGRILRILGYHAHDRGLKPSITVYNRWGKGPKRRLRFSKSGEPGIEEAYSRHFVAQGKGAASGKPRQKKVKKRSEPAVMSAGPAPRDILREVEYICELAGRPEGRVVGQWPLVYFSTETGDAWALDMDDGFALPLVRDRIRLPARILNSAGTTAIEWTHDFEIADAGMVFSDRRGNLLVEEGYPTDEILDTWNVLEPE